MQLTSRMKENIADIQRYIRSTSEELERMAWAFEPNSDEECFWLLQSDQMRAIATRIELKTGIE